MRLSLNLEINNIGDNSIINSSIPVKIPIEYRRMFMSYIKHCINQADNDLFTFYYGDHQNKIERDKPFTFSVFFPQLQGIEKTNEHPSYLLLSKNIAILNISTNDLELITAIYNGSLQAKKDKFSYKSFVIKLNHAYLHPLRKINDSKVKFKTLSPFLINKKGQNEDDNLKYLEYNPTNSGDFKDALKFNLIELCRKFLKYEPNIEIHLPPKETEYKKIVVSHYQQSMTANKMILDIEAPSDALQLFYDIGIGVRRSQGFGMLEVIN